MAAGGRDPAAPGSSEGPSRLACAIMRLFLAIALPFDRATALAARVPARTGWRPVPPGNMHLTLVFLGDRVAHDRAAELDELLAAIAFRLPGIEIAGCGHFGHSPPRAVWAGARPAEPLERLAAKLSRQAREAGIPVAARRFVPHVTLARMSAAADPARVAEFVAAQSALTLPPFQPREITLFRSHLREEGPIYEPLAEYPCG